MSLATSTVCGMKQRELFLLSDAALLDVIESFTPEQLELPVPAEWTSKPDPTLRDILADHAYDEVWVPDVLAGLTIEEVGDRYAGDLLKDDPITYYTKYNAEAAEAASQDLDPRSIVHLSYGDVTVAEYFEHISVYRAFQAYSIGTFLGQTVVFDQKLLELLEELVVPHIEEWRSIGVFPPEVPAPAGADAQTMLLAKTGYLRA
jgi:hypothetical protein